MTNDTGVGVGAFEPLETLEDAVETLERLDAEGSLDGLVATLRVLPDEVRSVGHYDGETVDLLYCRDDVAEAVDAEVLEDRIEAIVLHVLGDPPEDDALTGFGSLRTTVRWYDDVALASVPTGEWSSAFATFDRGDATPVAGTIERYDEE